MLTNRKELRIEWGDCDPGGYVYFPRYFEKGDACTQALFERAGLPKKEMLAKYGIAGIPMVEIKANFLVPSEYGERVIVESHISEWGRSSFWVRHKFLKGTALALEISEKRVWAVKTDGGLPLKGKVVPEEVKQKFEG